MNPFPFATTTPLFVKELQYIFDLFFINEIELYANGDVLQEPTKKGQL